MDMTTALAALSILGTAVFAASGALVAAEKRFDLIGALFLSVAAGLGGGTIIDVLMGARVRWIDAPETLWAALAAAVIVFEAARFRAPPDQALVWADAAGLALFTATGTQNLIALGLDPAATIFLTALGAAGGGIVRDVLANRAPLVFSGEIYVTAALLGALSNYAVRWTGAENAYAMTAALIVTFLVRAVGIAFKVRLLPGGIAPPRD